MVITYALPARVTHSPDGRIHLRPRPLASLAASFLLVPLLHTPPAAKALPTEIWTLIVTWDLHDTRDGLCDYARARDLLCLSRSFKDLILSLMYTHVRISHPSSLTSLVTHLQASERKWDSIRRNPHATPGRWVRRFDITSLSLTRFHNSDDLHSIPKEDMVTSRLHAGLAQALAFLPLLEELHLPSDFVLGRALLQALTVREGVARLRVVRGMRCLDEACVLASWLCASSSLEKLHLGVVHYGDGTTPDSDRLTVEPLVLLHLHTLALTTLPSASLASLLSLAHLPMLRTLALPPCPLSSAIIDIHGPLLHTLIFDPDRSSWPPSRHSTPSDILSCCPSLLSLSLSHPLAPLSFPDSHPLHTLALPAPRDDAAPFNALEKGLSRLPNLEKVQVRDSRWLRADLGARAMEVGIQGQLRLWRTRFAKRGVVLLDADGWDGASRRP